MMQRKYELEKQEQEEVAVFLAEHPEFREGRFEQEHRERRWVGGKNLTTVPEDPSVLNSTNLDAALGQRSTRPYAPSQEDHAKRGDYQKVRRNLFPAAEPRTDEQEVLRGAVEDAFERMRPRDVDMLRRRYLERMTLDAIAGEEGVTRQAILKRLATAEKHLMEALDAATVSEDPHGYWWAGDYDGL